MMRALWWLARHVGAYVYGVAVVAVAGVAVAVASGEEPMRSVLVVALALASWVGARYALRAWAAWRER